MKENWQLNRQLRWAFFALIAIILLIFHWQTMGRATDGAIWVEIPEEALRLRILAHSDHPQDQRLKEEVRDEVVKLIAQWIAPASTLDEARLILSRHLPQLAHVVEEMVRERGMDYGATVELGHIPFPAKLYGHRLYPAGLYEGVLITLGAGQGENWWCVLFPPLCFVDFSSGYAVQDGDEEGRNEVAVKDGEQASADDGPFGEAISREGDEAGERGEGTVQIRFFVLEVVMKIKGWLGW